MRVFANIARVRGKQKSLLLLVHALLTGFKSHFIRPCISHVYNFTKRYVLHSYMLRDYCMELVSDLLHLINTATSTILNQNHGHQLYPCKQQTYVAIEYFICMCAKNEEDILLYQQTYLFVLLLNFFGL